MIYPNTGTVLLFFSSFYPFLSQQENHHLYYKFSALTKTDKFPEFRAKAMFDDKLFENYSNDWIGAPAEPPDSRDWFIHQMKTLSNCTNTQCSELHVLQRNIGCELEKFNGAVTSLRAFDEYGFDGEDFLAFNSDILQWIDKNPKAKETKMKWDQQTERNQFLQHYLKTCMKWISTFNNTKKTPPDVRVFERKALDDHSKLILICLATGFYPRDIEMNIRLNKTILKDQTSTGIRPNADGSFQMRTSVKIETNHKGSYDCLIIHSSLTEPAVVEWGGKNADQKHFIWVVIGVAAAAAVVLIGICCQKKRENVQREMTEEHNLQNQANRDAEMESSGSEMDYCNIKR
uniref:Ig-like domain-containing protein n=1 Tax=Cyprinus carpio TaxID=7962 RepID=A0A8C1NLW0_CYPCA